MPIPLNPVSERLQSITYSGPQYYEIRERIKQENPDEYNRLQYQIAKERQPNSEIVTYTDAEGNLVKAHNIKVGYVSGTDPIGAEIVAGVALGKPISAVAKYVQRLFNRPIRRFINKEIKLVDSNKTVSNTSPGLSLPQTNQQQATQNIVQGYKDLVDYYRSNEYLDKLLQSGYSKKESQDIINQLLSNLNPRQGPFLDYSPLKIQAKFNPSQNGGYIAEQNIFRPTWQDRRIEVWSPDNYTTTLHEGAHASTLGITPKGTNPIYTEDLMKEYQPQLYKVLERNKTRVLEADNSTYLKDPQEVRSRAISTQVQAKRNKLTVDQIYQQPESNWTQDMKQLVDTYGKDRAIQITKDILTTIPLIYGTSRFISNNKD